MESDTSVIFYGKISVEIVLGFQAENMVYQNTRQSPYQSLYYLNNFYLLWRRNVFQC